MAAGDWYYQVWEQIGLRGRVHEVATYKVEYDAQEAADRLNAKARYYCHEGQAPSSFCFVQPVLEEHLRETIAERFRQHLHEDRERALLVYKGAFRNLAKEMMAYMLHAIEHCPSETYWRLYDHGGWLKGYSAKIKPYGDINCYALYSGIDPVYLQIEIERGKRACSITVDQFETEDALMAWLRNKPVAEASCEDRLIDLFYDRYHIQTE